MYIELYSGIILWNKSNCIILVIANLSVNENYYNLLKLFFFVTEAERCLEFQYVFFLPSERNKYSEIQVEYHRPDTSDWEVLGSFSGENKDKTTAALTLPVIQNLKVRLELLKTYLFYMYI